MLTDLLDKFTKDLDLKSVFAKYSSQSPNLHVEVLEIPTHRWDVSVKTIDIADPRDQRRMFSALNKLGAGRPFEWKLPLHCEPMGEAGGNTQVFAEAKHGTYEVQVYNASLAQADWLISGDLIRFANHTKVYQVADDCTTDVAGRCTVKLNQPLQIDVPASTTVLTRDVKLTLIYNPESSDIVFSRVAGDLDAQSYSLEFVEKL